MFFITICIYTWHKGVNFVSGLGNIYHNWWDRYKKKYSESLKHWQVQWLSHWKKNMCPMPLGLKKFLSHGYTSSYWGRALCISVEKRKEEMVGSHKSLLLLKQQLAITQYWFYYNTFLFHVDVFFDIKLFYVFVPLPVFLIWSSSETRIFQNSVFTIPHDVIEL